MDLDLDNKVEQQEINHTKIKDMVLGKGKIVKIRVTKKKRSVKKDSQDNNIYENRMNDKLISVFDELTRFMVKRGEPFKARAYQKAQETIVMYQGDITSENYRDLESLPGIGSNVIAKIDEYIKTGTLRVLERERADPYHIFTEIYGIGPKKAKDLIDKGITTIDQLRQNQDEHLNTIQQVGLKYYEDILLRIPRSEIDEYNKIFNNTYEKTKDVDTKYEIVGSYRRNVKSSGDIDVIITSQNRDVFKRFIDSLLEKGIILEILSRGPTKSLVIAKLPTENNARRVDFLYTTPEEFCISLGVKYLIL